MREIEVFRGAIGRGGDVGVRRSSALCVARRSASPHPGSVPSGEETGKEEGDTPGLLQTISTRQHPPKDL